MLSPYAALLAAIGVNLQDMELENIRREYLQRGLRRNDLNADPMVQFHHWLDQAVAAEITSDPTAMCLATVGSNGQPSQRIVLLKHADDNGFIFYTNQASRKAHEIEKNSLVCLHFGWLQLERQVIIYGKAEKLPIGQAAKYFMSRPRESQLAAWASQQSKVVAGRKAIMQAFSEMKQKFKDGEIPMPSFWGGYLVRPESIEFWQGGGNRLHDRFMYNRTDSGSWHIERLQP